MTGTKLKPCPFCGGYIKVMERVENVVTVYTKAECAGCGMEFEYDQDFIFSRKARVAINDCFETAFNRRVDDEHT